MTTSDPAGLLERDDTNGQRDDQSRTSPKDPWSGAQGPRLLCARCGGQVTASAWCIRVAESHEHSFINPHGYLFRIGCFSRAPGCAAHGEEQAAYSWFPGHSWRIALCAHCGVHLGWVFRSEDAGFHGLILERLVERSKSEGGEA